MPLTLMPRHPLLGLCQVDAVIDAHRFLRVIRDKRVHAQPALIEDRHQVSQIILLLRVVIADLLEMRKQQPVLETEDACVDLGHGQFLRRTVLGFHDPFDIPFCITDDPSIPLSVREHGSQHGHLAVRIGSEHPIDGLALNAGAVPVEDQRIAIQICQTLCLHDGMPGPQLRLLHGIAHTVSQIFPDAFCAMTDNDHDVVYACLSQAADNMPDHRLIGHWMHDFVQC